MAQAQLSFILKAYNDASKTFKEIEEDLLRVDNAGKKSSGGLKSMADGAKMAVAAVAGVAGAMVGVGVAVKKLVDDYTDYAMKVREVVTLIGATPEEASKLIQVADDVGVSFESLLTALEAGVRKGIEPTIENLGRLSDEYLKLQEGVARSEFLMANFGRSGTDLARVMELGSVAIQEMGDSIEGTGLLMTSQGIQSAEEYRIALDQLGDTAEGIKMTFAGALAPALTGFMGQVQGLANTFAKQMDILQMAIDKEISWGDAILLMSAAQYDLGAATEATNIVLNNHLESLGLMPDRLDEIQGKAYQAADAVSEGADSWGAYEQSIESALDKADNTDALKGMSDAAKQAAEEAAKAADKAAQAMVDAFWNVNPSLTSSITSAIEKVAWMEAGGRAAEQFFAAVMAAPADPNLGNNLVQSLILSLQASLASKGMNIWEAAGVLREDALKLGIEFTNAEAMAILNGEATFQPVDIPVTLTDEEGVPFDPAAAIGDKLVSADWAGPAGQVGKAIGSALNTQAVPTAVKGLKTTFDTQLKPVFTDMEGYVSKGATQLDRIVEQLGFIQSDAEGARAALQALQQQIDMLQGKKIDVIINITTTRTNYTYNYTYDMTGGSGGGQGRTPPGTGGRLGDATDWDPWRAEGGPVQSGERYIVGERGMELFVPNQSGYIVPNDDLRSMGGNTYILQIYSNAQREDLETDFRILESWARA